MTCPVGGCFVRDLGRRCEDGRKGTLARPLGARHRSCCLCLHFTISTPSTSAPQWRLLMSKPRWTKTSQHQLSITQARPALLLVIHRTCYTSITSNIPPVPLLVTMPALAAPLQAHPVQVDRTVVKLRDAPASHMVGQHPHHPPKVVPRLSCYSPADNGQAKPRVVRDDGHTPSPLPLTLDHIGEAVAKAECGRQPYSAFNQWLEERFADEPWNALAAAREQGKR
jgi:hypothetical protein